MCNLLQLATKWLELEKLTGLQIVEWVITTTYGCFQMSYSIGSAMENPKRWTSWWKCYIMGELPSP